MTSVTAPASKDSASHSLKGILLLLMAVVCFACMDASAKWLSHHTTALFTAGVRYVVSFVVVLAFINPRRTPGLLQTRHPWLQVFRGCCLLGTTIGCFVAFRYLPLTLVTAINFASPLLVALLAGPILGEVIGPRRVVAVLVGFSGVLLVTRPFGGGFHTTAIIALLAATSNAFYALLTRKLAADDKPETTMFYTSLVGTVVFLPILPFVWAPPASALAWCLLIVLGVFGAVGHWLLILAHRYAPASTLAPFFYAQIIGAAIFGMTVFGEHLDLWTVTGTGIVIASGLYLLHRERVRRAYPSSDVAA